MERIDREEFNAQLERRTLDFAVAVINALECLPAHPTLRVVIVQLTKSATSLGANYREANHAESRADRAHKISIVCKEASETLYWLDILLRLKFLTQTQKQAFELLRTESSELLALFRSIGRSLNTVSIKKPQNTNAVTIPNGVSKPAPANKSISQSCP